MNEFRLTQVADLHLGAQHEHHLDNWMKVAEWIARERPDVVETVVAKVKQREAAGWSYEAADASFELLLRDERDGVDTTTPFTVESYRVLIDRREDGQLVSEATVKVRAAGRRTISTAEGNGPVNALDLALYRRVRGVARTPESVRVVRSYSRLGERAAAWLALGTAGVAIDGARRGRWARATATRLAKSRSPTAITRALSPSAGSKPCQRARW